MTAEVHANALKLGRTEGGIACTKCGLSTAVGDSRPHGKAIKRRRYCKCGFRFTTFEHAIDELPQFAEMIGALSSRVTVALEMLFGLSRDIENIQGIAAGLRELEASRFGAAAKPLTPQTKD